MKERKEKKTFLELEQVGVCVCVENDTCHSSSIDYPLRVESLAKIQEAKNNL